MAGSGEVGAVGGCGGAGGGPLLAPFIPGKPGLICNPGMGIGGVKAYKHPEDDDDTVPAKAFPFSPALPASCDTHTDSGIWISS